MTVSLDHVRSREEIIDIVSHHRREFFYAMLSSFSPISFLELLNILVKREFLVNASEVKFAANQANRPASTKASPGSSQDEYILRNFKTIFHATCGHRSIGVSFARRMAPAR